MAHTTRRPLSESGVARGFKARRPKRKTALTVEHRMFVEGHGGAPEVSARVVPVESGEKGMRRFEVVVEIAGVAAGARAFPPGIAGTPVEAGSARRKKVDDSLLEGFIPNHLALDPVPRDLVRSHRTHHGPGAPEPVRPTTVFAPDDRMTFRDTSYPWGTIGLVETARGTSSGVVIGPRHVLTVSHGIDWGGAPGFAANWIRFTPSAFDGNAPFGEALGEHIYWYVQEDGDGTLDANELRFDYVVVVVDTRIGERTGWMGARGYVDGWDGLDAWQHMGYPGDLNSGRRPVFVNRVTLDGDDAGDDAHQFIQHVADVFPGQSGGPFFGWWTGDVGPRAVATQSGETPIANFASGGGDLARLVSIARTDFP